MDLNCINIGVLGWWHHNNQGDVRILQNMTRALAPLRVVPIDLPFPFSEGWLQRLNLLDFLIVGGGGLFQDTPPQPLDTFTKWGGQLGTPFGIAGVGVDKVLSEYRDLMSAIVEQAQFFYVRDEVSRQFLDSSKVQVAPDLSFLYPLNSNTHCPASFQHNPVCGFNLRRVPGLDTNQWIKVLRGLPVRLQGIPLSTYSTWQEVQILRRLDETCATAFDPGLYKGLDLMIGTAFHSILFAIQTAVPVIAIAYAPKVRRLMTEVGLGSYILEPDEWCRLPELVERVLDERNQLGKTLKEITVTQSEAAWQAISDIKKKIEQTACPKVRSGSRVSIVVVGDTSNTANQNTLASCLNQTYPNVEIIFVGDETHLHLEPLSSLQKVIIVPDSLDKSLGERLNRAFAHTSGEYRTWTKAGNIYAPDAINCMVDRLRGDASCEVVFTDYYTINGTDRITGVHFVDKALKLIRRDVVGPCFLYRNKIAETIGPFITDTPLVAYNYWLRAHQVCSLQPLHTRLFYATVPNEGINNRQLERETRHQWRSTRAWPLRMFWYIVDSDLVENLIIYPLLVTLRKLKAFYHRLKPNRQCKGLH